MDNEYFEAIQHGNDPISHYRFKKRYITASDIISIDELDPSVELFKFKNVLFKEDVDLKFIFFDSKKYEISHCEFEAFNLVERTNIEIYIRNTKFSDGKIFFLECNNIFFNLFNSKEKFELSFLNCHNFKIYFLNSVEVFMDISDSSITSIDLGNLYEKNILNIDINKSKIEKIQISNFEISRMHFISSYFDELILNDLKCKFLLSIDLQNRSVSKIELNRCEFEFFVLSGGVSDNFSNLIENYQMGKLDALNVSNCTNVNIQYVEISNITISGVGNSKMSLSYSKIENFFFLDFKVNDFFKIDSLISTFFNKFSLKNSNLNDLEITPSFLHLVKSFSFKNSSIIGVKVIGFEKIQESIIENSTEMTISEKIDFTRELGELMIKQGNRYLATVYKALEQDLRLESKQFNTKSDKLILILNSFSNAHGTKPEKAFGLMLGLILIHFLAMRVEFAWFNDSNSAIDFFWDNISYYIKPITFISDVDYKGYCFSKPFIVFDLFYKISFGYLLYQFIAAFRKFNK